LGYARPAHGSIAQESFVKARLAAVPGLVIVLVVAGCGGGSEKVSAESLTPRLLPSSSVPSFGLQRTLNWDDPVNLVGEGLSLPQATHPSTAVKAFKEAHLQGAAGEILTHGSGLEENAAQIGVAKFNSDANANTVRAWMHRQDLTQPCYSQCIFSPAPATIAGIPDLSMVVQRSHVAAPSSPPPGVKIPSGVSRRVQVGPSPAGYFAEFTIGPYLYWAILHANSTAQSQFEAGVRQYYQHARSS
jgi:hypothetical protein